MEVTRIAGQEEKQIKNVAAYARVSTLQEEQELSYNSQKEYYEAYIRSVPNWNFVGMYADQGKSGVREDRPEFTRMLNDAYAGKIDTILVKSISRFARNAIVTQNVVHKLKAHNVEVIFDEQKLSSFNRNSEMVLNMMATVAEHESRSISKNIRWALDKRAEQGIRNYGNNQVLGYDEVDGVLVPNESAWVVRYMYEQSAAGVSIQSIINELKKMGVKTMRGKDSFCVGTIEHVLRNELYKGDKLIQKAAPENLYTKKPDESINYDSYYIEDDHEPIVSKELWQKVQDRLNSYSKHKTQGSYFLKGKVYCGECGCPMRRISYLYHNVRQKVWQCSDRFKGKKGNGCNNEIISEEDLIILLSETLGVPYNGLDNLNPDDYECIYKVTIYNNGEIQLEYE